MGGYVWAVNNTGLQECLNHGFKGFKKIHRSRIQEYMIRKDHWIISAGYTSGASV